MSLTAKNFGLQDENINMLSSTHREIPLIKKTGGGTTEKERQMDIKRQKQRVRTSTGEDAVFCEKRG